MTGAHPVHSLQKICKPVEANMPQLIGSKHQFLWAVRKCGLLPRAERSAQQGRRAPLPTQDNNVIPESKVGVPGNESEVAGCIGCEDLVIAGFLLDSTNASKQRCRRHCETS
jgi:hypothetical protein